LIEAPETLEMPQPNSFTCLKAYEEAMNRYNFRGDWATDAGEYSAVNPCNADQKSSRDYAIQAMDSGNYSTYWDGDEYMTHPLK
jgi:hypothetical protein